MPCAVLAVSFLVEGYSLVVATRSVLHGAQAAGLSFYEYLRRGMDPTSIAVMMEDGAAVAGLAIAGSLSWPQPITHCLPILTIGPSLHGMLD